MFWETRSSHDQDYDLGNSAFAVFHITNCSIVDGRLCIQHIRRHHVTCHTKLSVAHITNSRVAPNTCCSNRVHRLLSALDLSTQTGALSCFPYRDRKYKHESAVGTL